ncbi:P-loop containing nucleoside triphosphate hydrolase protein [Pelagophyceae sp. CCMP2097]|nr:P-loop containing nucleoside triphosphate hydrolase protein [Pelagophyceae sp. CCMP2097]
MGRVLSWCCVGADVVVTPLLCLYRGALPLHRCVAALYFGSFTGDLAALVVLRAFAAALLLGRGEVTEVALDRWSHVNLAQLVYALSKGVSRALGGGARGCAESETLLFDGACALFAVFAYAVPAAMRHDAAAARRRPTKQPAGGADAWRASDASACTDGAGAIALAQPLLAPPGGEAAGAAADAAADAAAEGAADARATLREISRLAAPDAHIFAVALVFAVIAALCASSVSLWTGDALDALINAGDGREFKRRVAGLAVISVGGAVATGARGGCFSVLGVRINVRIRDKLFRHLLELELAFFDVTATGDLNSRLSSDTAKIGDQVSLNFNVFFRTLVQLLTTLAFMVHTSAPLTAMACCAVPVVGVATKRYGAFVWALAKAMQDELAAAQTVAEEALSAMLTVRSMAGEASVAGDFSKRLAAYRSVGNKQAGAYVLWQAFNTALPNLMTCLLLFYGGRLVDHGALQSGRLVAFMLLTQSLADSFNTLADMYSNIADALGAADKVFSLLRRPPAPMHAPQNVFEAPRAEDDFEVQGALTLRNVVFAYPARPEAPVLRGLSLDVPRGSVVALVGPSGSGKSSVLALIQHFYAPQSGTVLLDGRPVASLPHSTLHRAVAIVGQEPVLFMRSIERNIKYALEGTAQEPSRAAVDSALKMAHAAEFVRALPAGLDTNVGERGATMSGGQKQRVAIARALVRGPAVLLLDEATSALDAESERGVQDALDALIAEHKITVVVVAHRLSTIKNADVICVLRDGTLVEQGDHEDLMQRDGAYADLVRRQTTLVTKGSKDALTDAR